VLNKLLLIGHLFGLTLGLAASYSAAVVGGIISRAQPTERPILSQVPWAMSKLGTVGLILLWITGPVMVFTKYNGFGDMPWQFHLKLTAVVIMTLAVGVIHMHRRRAMAGDVAAMGRIQLAGKVGLAGSLTALVTAVLAFG